MKIWKIAGVLVVLALILGAFGVGMVFAQGVVPNRGTNTWGGMMGGIWRSAGQQGTPVPGWGMGNWAGGMMGRGGMMGGYGGMMGFGVDMNAIRQWMMGPGGMHTQVLTDLAGALHLSLAELQSQLQSGKTLNQIAQAQGVSQAQLESALETSMQANLAKAVAAGKLTQQQADQMLSYMKNHYSQMLEFMSGYPGGCFDFDEATPTGSGS